MPPLNWGAVAPQVLFSWGTKAGFARFDVLADRLRTQFGHCQIAQCRRAWRDQGRPAINLDGIPRFLDRLQPGTMVKYPVDRCGKALNGSGYIVYFHSRCWHIFPEHFASKSRLRSRFFIAFGLWRQVPPWPSSTPRGQFTA